MNIMNNEYFEQKRNSLAAILYNNFGSHFSKWGNCITFCWVYWNRRLYQLILLVSIIHWVGKDGCKDNTKTYTLYSYSHMNLTFHSMLRLQSIFSILVINNRTHIRIHTCLFYSNTAHIFGLMTKSTIRNSHLTVETIRTSS